MKMKLVAGLGLAAVVSQNAFAANPDFSITHRVATYTSKTTEVGDSETEESGISWADFDGSVSNIEFAMFYEGWAVYAYPFNPTAQLWIGKNLGGVEVGPTFRFAMTDVKDSTESSEFALGAYVFYGMDLGVVGLETNLNPYFISSSIKETATTEVPNPITNETSTVSAEVETSGFGLFWDLLVTKKVGDNFTWAGGLEVTYESTTAEADGGAEVDTTLTSIGVVLSEFRYSF
jgi:hypothetical protein